VSPIAFTLWGVGVTWLEVAGDVTGLLCVWLVTKEKVWNWPVGLVNTVLFSLLFLQSKLYADATLQVFFFGMGIWGWWSWVKNKGPNEGPPVTRMSKREWLVLGGAAVATTAVLTLLMRNLTDSPAPLADTSILVQSLCATWAQVKKRLESWWIWLGVDMISVPLYVSRELYPTALLYVLFGCLCVVGLQRWKTSMRNSRA